MGQIIASWVNLAVLDCCGILKVPAGEHYFFEVPSVVEWWETDCLRYHHFSAKRSRRRLCFWCRKNPMLSAVSCLQTEVSYHSYFVSPCYIMGLSTLRNKRAKKTPYVSADKRSRLFHKAVVWFIPNLYWRIKARVSCTFVRCKHIK